VVGTLEHRSEPLGASRPCCLRVDEGRGGLATPGLAQRASARRKLLDGRRQCRLCRSQLTRQRMHSREAHGVDVGHPFSLAQLTRIIHALCAQRTTLSRSSPSWSQRRSTRSWCSSTRRSSQAAGCRWRLPSTLPGSTRCSAPQNRALPSGGRPGTSRTG
jgi:hypothetical protein